LEAERVVNWKIAKLVGGKESSARIKLSLDVQAAGDHKRELGPLEYEKWFLSS
jgi:hypothetical protein